MNIDEMIGELPGVRKCWMAAYLVENKDGGRVLGLTEAYAETKEEAFGIIHFGLIDEFPETQGYTAPAVYMDERHGYRVGMD